MNPLRKLFAHFKEYHSHDRPVIQYSGAVGVVAFPLFYLLRFAKADAPFNDIGLRILAIVLCAGLALRHRWPEQLKPYYFTYAYVTLLYCMPFFFIFTSLVNGGGVVGVANTLMAVFFLVLLSDWRNSVLMLVIGSAAAAGLYALVVPDAQLQRDYVGRLPVMILVVIGASVFKFAQKQAEAEKIKRTYTSLAGSIAHEMRNPLSQIKHNLERLQQALPPPTTAVGPQAMAGAEVDALYRHLAESEMAVKRGLQVISMTLDEVSAKPLDATAFSYLSAAEVTEKAVREYGYETDADRGRVSVDVAEDFNFRGEETAYIFVLFNLIKNALYYVALRPDARVAITIERQQVKVRDSGPGMAPEILAGLFEPFRSVGKSGGTGLGLAYCQRVMHAFGGTIGCESVLGAFTQFTLCFPVISAQESEAYWLAALGKAQAAFSGKRLLVVDDDAALRSTTCQKLQMLGAAISEAAGGQQAVEMLARERYDLVVLDLNMPLLDGYAVAEKIRKGNVLLNRDTCIVAYSSEPAYLMDVKSQKAGMDGFVSKPCPQLPLIRALHQALEHSFARTHPDEGVLSGLCVLLADDNPYNRKAVAAYLRHAGAAVVEAGHGQAVLEHLFAGGDCDAVLMDINMPGMDGFATARAIRDSRMVCRDVPIIALTAHSDETSLAAAAAAGMNDFITKPVHAALLYNKLRLLLRGSADPAVEALALVAPSVEVAHAQSEPPLLNLERLQSYQRIGMLEELLADYLPEIARLVSQLDRSVLRQDLPESLQVLHSLLGMSGEAGASALYQLVRRAYVPMVEERRWPVAAGWLEQLKAVASQTEQALKAYGEASSNANVI